MDPKFGGYYPKASCSKPRAQPPPWGQIIHAKENMGGEMVKTWMDECGRTSQDRGQIQGSMYWTHRT